MSAPWPERALSIRQPWADLIMAGIKDVENRTWSTPHGFDLPQRIAVHASKRWDRSDAAIRALGEAGRILSRRERRMIGFVEPMKRAMSRTGVLVGFVTVTGCHPADMRSCFEDGHDGGLCSRWAEGGVYHWTLADPEPLDEPIPMRGALGLWRPTYHRSLDEQLGVGR